MYMQCANILCTISIHLSNVSYFFSGLQNKDDIYLNNFVVADLTLFTNSLAMRPAETIPHLSRMFMLR